MGHFISYLHLIRVSILTIVTVNGYDINPLYPFEEKLLQMVLKLTDILDDPICFTNDNKKLYQKYIAEKKGTSNKVMKLADFRPHSISSRPSE